MATWTSSRSTILNRLSSVLDMRFLIVTVILFCGWCGFLQMADRWNQDVQKRAMEYYNIPHPFSVIAYKPSNRASATVAGQIMSEDMPSTLSAPTMSLGSHAKRLPVYAYRALDGTNFVFECHFVQTQHGDKLDWNNSLHHVDGMSVVPRTPKLGLPISWLLYLRVLNVAVLLCFLFRIWEPMRSYLWAVSHHGRNYYQQLERRAHFACFSGCSSLIVLIVMGNGLWMCRQSAAQCTYDETLGGTLVPLLLSLGFPLLFPMLVVVVLSFSKVFEYGRLRFDPEIFHVMTKLAYNTIETESRQQLGDNVDTLTLRQRATLEKIDMWTTERPLMLAVVMMSLGFETTNRMKNRTGSTPHYNSANAEIESNLGILIKAGLIELVDWFSVAVTPQGKEFLALPPAILVTDIPGRFIYRLARAEKCFREGDAAACLNVCATEVLESFTKWCLEHFSRDAAERKNIHESRWSLNTMKEKLVKTLDDSALTEADRSARKSDKSRPSYLADKLSNVEDLLDVCINIRNEYMHDGGVKEGDFSSPKAAEDAYNLLNLSRAYMTVVCRHFIVAQ